MYILYIYPTPTVTFSHIRTVARNHNGTISTERPKVLIGEQSVYSTWLNNFPERTLVGHSFT